MNQTFGQILCLIERGDMRISDRGYDEMAAEGLNE